MAGFAFKLGKLISGIFANKKENDDDFQRRWGITREQLKAELEAPAVEAKKTAEQKIKAANFEFVIHPPETKSNFVKSDANPYSEADFWEVSLPKSVRRSFLINYVDSSGARTKRTIDVIKFGNNGYGSTVLAVCHLRQEFRTFRTDRMQECVDCSTGEIIDDLSAHLQELYEKSPERKASKLLENEYDTIRILYYIGKADGRLMAAEKKIICDTCREMTGESSLTDKVIEDLLYGLPIPTERAFKLAVGRLSQKNEKHLAMVMKAARGIIFTQKTVHPAEIEAVEYMRKRLEP